MTTAANEAKGGAAGIAAAIACASVVGAGLALTTPLLALLLDARGVTPGLNGLSAAATPLGSLAFGPFVPAVAARFGVRATLVAALVAGAASLVLMPVLDGFTALLALRSITGASLIVIYVLSEFWITVAAPAERRGLVLGLYATSLSLGFAAGPAVLAVTGIDGPQPFVVGAALFLAATLPLLGVATMPPSIPRSQGASVVATVGRAPAAMLGSLVFGAVEQGCFALLAIWGIRSGLGGGSATLLLSAMVLGNVLFQVPIGLISDAVDRHALLLACGASALAAAVALPMLEGAPAIAACVFVMGGSLAGLYTIGLGVLGSRFTGSDLATANATFVMLYFAGGLVGPPLLGAAMERHDPHGLPTGIAILCLCHGLLVLARLRTPRSGR